jgi:hypothetical protein
MLLGVALALGITTGCSVEQDAPAASVVDEATEIRVLEATLGGSYDLHVEPSHGEHGPETQAVLRFPVTPGQPFAAIMRRQDDGPLDAWLALYVDGHRVAVSDWDQGMVPMADESDAIVIHTTAEATEVMLVAGDIDLAAQADFQVDLVALAAPATEGLAFHQTSPATRALTAELRALEPELQNYLDAAMASEDVGGQLVAHPKAAPSLKDRVALNGFVARQNDLRDSLFHHLVNTVAGVEDPALEPVMAAVCGATWTALRGDVHRLR